MPEDCVAATGPREQVSSLYDIATHFGTVCGSEDVAAALLRGTPLVNRDMAGTMKEENMHSAIASKDLVRNNLQVRRRSCSSRGPGLRPWRLPRLARAADPIRIGVLQPLSGGLEGLGQQGVQGTQLAIEEANAAGGVLDGRMFELVIEDDKTDPKTAVERTQKLIQGDNVVGIFGPVTSANRDAMQPTLERFKTPLFYATDYEGGVCSRYIICYSALPEHWVVPFVPWLKENYGDSFYLFGSDYVWPQKMNAAVARVVGEVGGTVAGEEYTPFGVKDFTATVRKIGASGAKVLVLDVVGADAITFVKQFTAAGLKEKMRLAWLGYSENYSLA